MADVVFVVDKVSIGKVWDKAMGKPAAEAFQAGVEKALNSSGTKTAKSLGKDEKGFKVTLTLESLDLDAKKNLLSMAVKGAITALPRTSMWPA